ncbi:MAG: hypothetical protein BHV68_08410 [Bacteroidales bacterium 43_8]|nr:MAG: hypothetical protein BHV68_08410 [Bacteroidales bacterium 43_8]
MLFEIRNYASNILYIKRIKTLVFNYLYYIYRGYNNCLCTSVFGGYANVIPLPFMSYRFLFSKYRCKLVQKYENYTPLKSYSK